MDVSIIVYLLYSAQHKPGPLKQLGVDFGLNGMCDGVVFARRHRRKAVPLCDMEYLTGLDCFLG